MGKVEMETGAFARAALYHDVPLVQLNEFLTKHQAEARPFLPSGSGSAECTGTEKLFDLIAVHTLAVILNGDDGTFRRSLSC